MQVLFHTGDSGRECVLQFYLAPLEGVTTYIFRNAFETYFSGADCYFTPFIAPNQKRPLRTRELRDVLPENNHVRRLIPQILTNDAKLFKETVHELSELGYEEVNLNLGCPSGTVASRGRGAGFLSHPEELDRFLDQIFADSKVRISVKTRIGVESPEEIFNIIEIYNKYPLSELIVHPRTRQEFYRGIPHTDIFEKLLPLCRMPVCYNGNLLTVREVQRFQTRFSGGQSVSRVMIGRGAIANPGLIRELADLDQARGKEETGTAQNVRKTEKKELHAFHDEIFSAYRALGSGDLHAVSRMKELWIYMQNLFAEADTFAKKIHKAKNPDEYLTAVDQIFCFCELLPDGPVRWKLPQK